MTGNSAHVAKLDDDANHNVSGRSSISRQAKNDGGSGGSRRGIRCRCSVCRRRERQLRRLQVRRDHHGAHKSFFKAAIASAALIGCSCANGTSASVPATGAAAVTTSGSEDSAASVKVRRAQMLHQLRLPCQQEKPCWCQVQL